jgi:hypothetical protein
MLHPLKKSHDRSDGKQFLSWHPNFADSTRLPDVKVVRTTFFLNAASIVILGAMIVFVANREFVTYQVKSDLAAREAEIKTTKVESDRAVIQYTKYKDEVKKLTPVVNLTADSFVFSDFVIHLAEKLPQRITVQKIVCRGAGQATFLSLTAQGLDDASVEMASAYVKEMQADDYYKVYFGSVALSNIVRNAERSTLTLEIVMNPKSTKK